MGEQLNGGVRAATTYDADGPGPLPAEPVIGGFFTHSGSTVLNGHGIFRNGQWVMLGSGPGGVSSPSVEAMTVMGTDLIAGGVFTTMGGIPAVHVARWDGSAWHAFSQELFYHAALHVHNNQIFSGGGFNEFPNFRAIGRWDGTTWAAVGQGYPRDTVYALATYRDTLIAAGSFGADGIPPDPYENIAAWDGTTWRPLGPGLNGVVRALAVFDPDGAGPLPEVLIAGGGFNATATGQPMSGIAAWDGVAWQALGSGTSGEVRALTVWPGQGGPDRLVVGGNFYMAGGIVSPGMAFWGCPAPACYANCDGSSVPPALNVSDFICFLNKYAAGDSLANCDGSTTPPALNVTDFICFLNRYAAGCPLP
ncbi:MAG: GC-type dockerin domain-anchored protein [Phycisphaerales bacterium]